MFSNILLVLKNSNHYKWNSLKTSYLIRKFTSLSKLQKSNGLEKCTSLLNVFFLCVCQEF